MRIKCLIVDDEPLSQEVIETYIKDFPVIELVKKCNNAIEALEALKEYNIQLIFLDINMPLLSGIDMVKSLASPPYIIFTSAYAQYAIDGFELDAVDYLVKPFSFERFIKAVNKAREKIEIEITGLSTRQSRRELGFIMIKADKKLYKINFDEISYFNSIGDYVKVVGKQGKIIITNDTLKNIESFLPDKLFVRIHKSYLVSISSIRYIESNHVMVDNYSIPIGLKYKENLITKFNTQ
jgi:DNA-binding LytR/AlgR family response regulator